MSDTLLLRLSVDDIKQFKCACSIACGLVTASAIVFDASSLNYTNSLGRHFSAWYTSCIHLFGYFTDSLELPLVTLIGHLLIQAVFVILVFQWWNVFYWMARVGAWVICKIAYLHKRLPFKKNPTLLEGIVITAMITIALIMLMLSETKLPPGTWVADLVEPITKRIVPMWDLGLDWTVYPRQLLKYLITAAIWLLWWVPIVALIEFPVAALAIEFRRKNESIQGGDDGL